MESAIRLPTDVVVTWKDRLIAERGAADVALKEILRALQDEGSDGHVPVTRHQLFSWTQAVEGAAVKRPALAPLAQEMRSYLGAEGGRRRAEGAGTAVPGPAVVAPAPAIVYQKPAAQPAIPSPLGSGASRIVPHQEIAGFVGEMIRDAKTELLVVAPWQVGLDTLANAILLLPPAVAVRAITRRPPQEDESYHRLMQQLRKRGVDVVFSASLMTRMVLADGQRLLLGAASVPPAGAPVRETAIASTDAALVQAARAEFARLLEEARGR